MANNLLSNPMVITGSMSGSYKTQYAAAAGQPIGAAQTATKYGTLFALVVEKLYWFNPQTVGDLISIGDPNSGLILVQLRCEVANQSQLIDWTANPKLWNDFEINAWPDVGSTLYIYTR